MTLPNKQLWIVERRDVDPVKKIYVFADRWFDVRTTGGMKLNTHEYANLFISAVMAEIDVFKDPENLVGVFDVDYTGNASSGTLERHVLDVLPPEEGVVPKKKKRNGARCR